MKTLYHGRVTNQGSDIEQNTQHVKGVIYVSRKYEMRDSNDSLHRRVEIEKLERRNPLVTARAHNLLCCES